MAVYYIDPKLGCSENNGLSPESPLATEAGLAVQPGDTVLFKRGSFIRDCLHVCYGEEGNPVTYAAYGEGENPVFAGCIDVSHEENWQREPGDKPLWKLKADLPTKVCNFIFNGSEGAALQWEKEELSENGDWWDNGFGDEAAPLPVPEDRAVLLYCEENPARYYSHIECVLHVHRSLASSGHDVNYYDLTFYGNGVHALAGGPQHRRLHIKGCRFEFIGGCVWSKKLHIRFGNGVEFWNEAEDITVENCFFYEIYDSGVTHQGSHEICKPAVNLVFKNNTFIRCGMAAYEQRDILPLSGEFTGNVCADAGRGFSHRHTTTPRQSEIWPQPMGHHLFIWRIDGPTENAKFSICENTFLDAPAGAAIYSIIDRAAEEQTVIDRNLYQMRECVLVNRYFGKDYAALADYIRETGKDVHAVELGK